MKSKISIIGCGWLGLPLAEALLEENYFVKGSTTSPAKLARLKEKGIEAFVFNANSLEDYDRCKDLFESNCVIINIPPGRSEEANENYLNAIQQICSVLSKTDSTIVFVSSTSVYPDCNRLVDETCELLPTKSSGLILLECEQLVQKAVTKATILRFAGLVGGDRVPGKFLAGKKQLKSGNAPVNLIHRDDCIAIISQIVRDNIWGKTYNACCDIHPMRKDYYIRAAEKAGLLLPEFENDDQADYKIVSNEKLKQELNYSFIYPDPNLFLI